MRIREWVAASTGVAAVGVAIFALGGAPRWAQSIVADLVAVAVFAQVGSRNAPARIPPLVVMLGIASGLTMLQLLPVGEAVVRRLNPTGAALRADGALIAGVSPDRTLTFDVPGSLSSLAFFLTLLGVATVALRIATTERGRYGLLATVAGLCGLTALVVGMHALVGTRLLYGVYEPLHASPAVLGPLLNANQLGCLMAVGSVVAGGLVFNRRQSAWMRVMWIVIATGCAVAGLATLSRGAAIALACGAIVLATTLAGQVFTNEPTHTKRRGVAAGSLKIGVVVVCAIVTVIYASSGGVARQIEGTSLSEFENPRSKFVAWRNAAELVEESPWIGWGRGAFESAFTRVHPTSGLATFSYLENEYLQTVVDWGIPGAVLVAIAGIWLSISALSRWRRGPLAAAGVAGLTVVALQSNVDFGVEFLGLAIPTTILAATLSYVPMRQPGHRALRMARAVRCAHAIALLAGAAVLLSTATTTVEEDHDQIKSPLTLDEADLTDALGRHPLDYRGYLLEAVVLTRHHDHQRAIHVLNHALELHPTHSGLHLFLGELLRESGNMDQAAVEYATAVRSSTDPQRLIDDIIQRMPTADLIARSIPLDANLYNDVVQIFERLHRPDVALIWLQRVLATGRDNQRPCSTLYTLAARSHSIDAIAIASEKCPQFTPTTAVRRHLARTALDNHDASAALRLLADVDRWTGNVNDKFEAWLTRCDAYFELGQLDDTEHCLHQLDATGYAPKRELIEKRLEAIASARLLRDDHTSVRSSELVRWFTRVISSFR